MNLGEWRPDQPPHGHDGLVVARTVSPSALGYEPVKDYSSITTALASTWKGGMPFIGVDGSVALLAGTDAGGSEQCRDGTGWFRSCASRSALVTSTKNKHNT